MKVFVDTEFNEIVKDGVPILEVISMGLVGMEGASMLLICKEFDIDILWYSSLTKGNEYKIEIINTLFNQLLEFSQISTKTPLGIKGEFVDYSKGHSELNLYNLKYLLHHLGSSK